MSRQVCFCSQFLVIVRDALRSQESKQQLKVKLTRRVSRDLWITGGRHSPRQAVLLIQDQIL